MSSKPPSKPPAAATPLKTPAPPKTRSGEMTAVREFQKEIDAAADVAIPQMDAAADRMGELLRSVTDTPKDAGRVLTPIPGMPRTPSMIDADEFEAIPEPPVTVPEFSNDDEPDSNPESTRR